MEQQCRCPQSFTGEGPSLVLRVSREEKQLQCPLRRPSGCEESSPEAP